MTMRATMMPNAIARMSELYMPRSWQGADKVNPAVFPPSPTRFAPAGRTAHSLNVPKSTSRLHR
jgi:hypothetical protein